MFLKLFTTCFDYPPEWFSLFQARMTSFKSVAWEHFPLEKREKYLHYFTKRTGTLCNKREIAVCDLRPALGDVFADRLHGYDYWGWCDIDVLMSDLDNLLPKLLEGYDVLNFKPHYLSGPFAIFRNIPELTQLYRQGPYREIFADPRNHLWEDSGREFGLLGAADVYGCTEKSFYNLVVKSGYKMKVVPELYSYDSPREWNFIEHIGNRLIDPLTRDEKLFHHFMTKVWPIDDDGFSRFRGRGKGGTWPDKFNHE